MSDMAREYGDLSFSPNIFTPYPGLPIWPQLKELGVREPQSLKEWETFALGVNVLALVARGRVAAPATQPRVLSSKQSDSKSDEKTSLAAPKPPQGSLAHRCAGAFERTSIRFRGSSGYREPWKSWSLTGPF